MRPWGFWLAFMLTIAATTAEADIRACTEEEYRAASSVGWDEDDHQLFQIPPIIYDRPKTEVIGVPLHFVVDTDGQIVCWDHDASTLAALNETPERRALIAQMETWRFKPFLENGEPVRSSTQVLVPEKVEFQFHEDMPVAPASDMTITLDRTTCYGPCPDYTVTLHGNGWVEYDGDWYTAVRGKHIYSVDPAEIATLMADLKANDIWSMSGNWVIMGYDAAWYKMDVTIGDEHRHFEDYFGREAGIPPALQDFMDEVDRVGRTNDFIHLSSFAVQTLENEGFAFRSPKGADLFLQAVNDDKVTDDAALLRLIELGVPALAGRPDTESYKWPADPPLVAALRNRHTGLIEPLISMGALDIAGKPDQSKIDAAFQAAIAGGRLAAVERIWQIAGSRPHPSLTVKEKDDDGKTIRYPVALLLKPAENDDGWEGRQIVEWLTAQGCDLHARGREGQTLLEIAVDSGDMDLVKYLLARGVDPRTPGSYDYTVLEGVYSDEDMAMLLIEAGADPWTQKSERDLFVDRARDKGWTRVLAWMEAHRPQGQEAPQSHN